MNSSNSKHSRSHYAQTIIQIAVQSLTGSILWVILFIVGLVVLLKYSSPVNLIAGFPLVLIGGAKLANSIWDMIMSVFSPKFNQARCLVCHPKGFGNEE